MEIIADSGTIFIILAALVGIFMAWGIGANDVANAMGTSIGAGALTIKRAVIVAAIFEFAGAFLAGGQVTSTIRKGIIDSTSIAGSPELLVYGMLAALLAAACWLLVASALGWPVSTTHSIVGAIVGFAIVGIGMEAVKWTKVGTIVASWVTSPLLAGVMSFLLVKSVQKLILDTDSPFQNAKRYVPIYIFLTGFMIALVTLFKGLKHVGIKMSGMESFVIAVIAGLVVMAIGIFFINRITIDEAADREFHFASVEKVFGVLMIVTACAMAFAHGSNDVANAIGPVAAVVSVVSSGGEIGQKAALSPWILFIGGGGIVVGLITFGKRVIATIGEKITHLTPSRGFAAELAAASTVVLASGIGLPISTTHTLVGAVIGVALARGITALNLRVVGTIVTSWVITLPAGGILAALFFYMFKGIFS